MVKQVPVSWMWVDTTFVSYGMTDVCYKGKHFQDSLSYYGVDECFLLYDSLTSHPLGKSYDVSVNHILEQIEVGYPFIQFDGHGDYDCFKIESPYFFRNENARSIENPVYSMIVTSACSTNGFDEDCLSESFMRNPNGKIIAYWGGTLEVLGIDDERLLSPIDYINLHLYKHLFRDYENHLGDAVNAVRLEYTSSGNMPYSNPYRWLLLCMNLLGDPEMPIYMEEPKDFYYKDLYFDESDGSLYVNFLEEVPTKVCIMSLDDDGESFYYIDEIGYNYPNMGYNLNFLDKSKDYSLCFTRSGYKPYIINLYNTGKVQNDTIANDAVIWSNNAYIGSNVTTQKPFGPVLVKKGDVIIKAPHGVMINNNFVLRKGATLIIDPNIREFSDAPE